MLDRVLYILLVLITQILQKIDMKTGICFILLRTDIYVHEIYVRVKYTSGP